jgi:hypothetical protein
VNLRDKQAILNKFADVKRAHDGAVPDGAKCGSKCWPFHKAATPTASKDHTVERARAFKFLLDLGQQIN